MNPSTFIFFGPSGSGKGTQAKLLIEKLRSIDPDRKVLYLETGEKLREFAKGDSFTAQKTKDLLNAGGLMPEFLPIMLWSEFFAQNLTGDEHIVIDGISRKVHEAWILDTAMQFYGMHPTIISLKVSPRWATERLEERGRIDDKDKEIARRLAWYETNVVPALKHFRSNPGYNFLEINGEQSIEDVQKEILEKLGL
jgi:adenylate kinase